MYVRWPLLCLPQNCQHRALLRQRLLETPINIDPLSTMSITQRYTIHCSDHADSCIEPVVAPVSSMLSCMLLQVMMDCRGKGVRGGTSKSSMLFTLENGKFSDVRTTLHSTSQGHSVANRAALARSQGDLNACLAQCSIAGSSFYTWIKHACTAFQKFRAVVKQPTSNAIRSPNACSQGRANPTQTLRGRPVGGLSRLSAIM